MTAPKRIRTGRNLGNTRVRGTSNFEREFYDSWKTDYVDPALRDMVKKKKKERNA